MMAAVPSEPPAVSAILGEFPSVCSVGTGVWQPPLHGVEHVVEMTGRLNA